MFNIFRSATPKAANLRPYLLNVYFEGTSGILNANQSLVSVLSQITINNDSSETIAFDGCGVTGPHSSWLDFDGVFTWGLSKQVSTVVHRVEQLLKNPEIGLITLNTFGFSRGGAAVFLLCQELKSVCNDPNKLQINVASLEPVPGNLVGPVKADFMRLTLTNQILDIQRCQTLNELLVLYTNQLLYDPAAPPKTLNKMVYDAHMPVLPKHSAKNASIDIIPGCHLNAQICYLDTESNSIAFSNIQTYLAFARVFRFLKANGTALRETAYELNHRQVSLRDIDMVSAYRSMLPKHNYAMHRLMHQGDTITTTPDQPYLNQHHKMLVNPISTDANNVTLRITSPVPTSKMPSQQIS